MAKHYAVRLQDGATLYLRLCMTVILLCTVLFSIAQSAETVSSSSIKGPFAMPSNEGGVSSLDALPPTITYTPLTDICATGNRVLTATITDVDGVPTSGSGLPVLYFKINSGPYTAVTGVSIGSNQYTFTFGGTALPGNVVSYYIVAQDNASTPNVGAFPSAGASGFSANPPDASTPPTAPNFYVIQNTLAAGTYLVGAGQTYTNITDAINAYNNSCLSGPVVFALTDATYGTLETFPITIYNAAANATNTLTIKPNAGVNATITGSNAEALFKLYGADYVIFEGSNNNSTSRNLTIINTNTSAFASSIWIGSQSASNGATNNIIRNCKISGNSGISAGNVTYAGIISCSGVNIGFQAEGANSNNTYRNNVVDKVLIGIQLFGPAGGDANTIVDKNTLGSTIATNYLGYRGLMATNQTGLTVSANAVTNISSSFGTGSDTDPTAGIILNGASTGANIFGNTISGIRNTSVTGWQSFGICLQSSSLSANTKVYNNFLYAIAGNGRSNDPAANGHAIAALTGAGYGIYFNSVFLGTNQAQAGITSCLYIGTGMTSLSALDVRNNIFSNRQTIGTRYAIYSAVPATVFSQIDYNDYYSSQRVGFLVSNQANLASWQLATGSDLNSVATDPIYVSTADLHMQLISPMNNIGTPIAGITSDIDGDVRSATTPDIGADEFTPPNCTGNNPGTISANKTNLCFTGSVLLSSTGFDYGAGMSYQWQSSSDNVTWANIVGENNPVSATPAAISATTYYRLRVACTNFSGGTFAYSNVVTITVQAPAVTSTLNGSRCGPGTINLSANGSSGTTVNWYDVATGGEILGTGTTFTTPSISTTTTYYAEATFPGSNGTVGPSAPLTAFTISSVQYTSFKVNFNVLTATKLISVDVYPIASGQTSTLTVNKADGTVLASVPYVTSVSGGTTAQQVVINVDLDPGVGYYLYTVNSENGLPPSGLRRDISGASYPYTSSDIEITGNEFNNSFYMCYYRWKFSNACATSPRSQVTATIGAASTISVNATPTTLCVGSSTTIAATSGNTSYTYNWMPGNINAASITVSPTTNTKYIVTASDGSCTAKDSVTITIVSAPSTVVTTPASNTKCNNAPAVALSGTGGITSVVVLSEDFNGASLPSNWVVSASGGTAANQAVANWQLRPNGYSNSGFFFKSNDSSQFILSNCMPSGAGSAAKTLLIRSPQFSTSGVTNATIKLYHTFAYSGSNDSANIDISINGGTTWFLLKTWKQSIGASNSFKLDSIVLPPAYLNQSTVNIRLRHNNTNQFFWAVDNISITGNDQQMPIIWSPTAGLFTDAAATIPYTGGGAFTVYANPAATTDYIATATGLNGCAKKDTSTITLRPVLSGTLNGSTAVCPFGAATLSINLTGVAPWSFTYTDGTTPVTVTGVNSSPYTFVVNPAVTTTYSITALSDAFCTAIPANYSTTATVTVNPTAFSTWLGLSTDWMDPTNWCGGLPTNTKDVIIPGSLTNYPIITAAGPVSRDLQINSGATLTIQSGASIGIAGNVVNNGTVNNQGSIVLNGTGAQSFPGGTTGVFSNMNILEVNKASGAVTINKKVRVNGIFKPTAGNVILSDTIVITSNASGTASIDQVGATASFTYNGAGKFTVERYIPTGIAHGKGWQFLAPATKGQTVKQAWQEGAAAFNSNPVPGFGTTLTSDIAGATGLGFDFYTPGGGPSIKVYSQATNQFTGIANTSLPIDNSKGYMIFVRGDRSVISAATAANQVTLRSSGKIYAPGAEAPPSLAVGAGKLESVGNPYASAIDFSSLQSSSTGLDAKYYVWDPLLAGSYGYGGYQTISSSNSWIPTPGGTTNYPTGVPYKKIQSGQAFFVYSTPGGTVSFAEANKTTGNQTVFRGNESGNRYYFRTYLYLSNGTLADGNAVAFDPQFSNDFESNDALKIGNVSENIGIQHAGQIFAVDARSPIVQTDTIWYQLGNLRNNSNYRLKFAPERINLPGLQAYLIDQWNRSTTPVSLTQETDVVFDVTTDPATRAADRFYIVFRQARPVPVQFIAIQGIRKGAANDIRWQVANEMNVAAYAVERSAEGRLFTPIGRTAATGNGQPGASYAWLDQAPLPMLNYYRIRSIDQDGRMQYSPVVKIYAPGVNEQFVLTPNPTTAQAIYIAFQQVNAGKYQLNLINSAGQRISSQSVYHPGGSLRHHLKPAGLLAAGVYQLEISAENGDRLAELSLILQ